MSGDIVAKKKSDFASDKVMFYPFNSGPKSLIFVLKSVLFYAVGMTILYLVFNKSTQAAAIAYQEQVVENPDKTLFSYWAYLGKNLPYAIGLWALWAMIEAALFRRIFFGADNRTLPWRFGKDELRVMLCQLVVLIVSVVALFLSVFVFSVIAIFIGYIAGPAIADGLTFVGIIAAYFVAAAVAIRFAPAASRSIAEKRIALGSVWPVAYKRFWPAFGSYAILLIVGILIYIILALVIGLIVQGPEMLESWKIILSGDTAKALERSRELAQKEGVDFGALFLSGLGNMYFAALGLCLAGVGVYLNVLYDKREKGDDGDKDSGTSIVQDGT